MEGPLGDRGVTSLPAPGLAISSAALCFAEENGVPKTTLYSVSLDTLGLCLERASGYEEASIALAKQVLSPANHLSVGKGPLRPRRVPSARKAPLLEGMAVTPASRRHPRRGGTGVGVHLQPDGPARRTAPALGHAVGGDQRLPG